VERRIFHIATPVNPSEWASHLKDEQSSKFLEAAKAEDRKSAIKSAVVQSNDKLYVPPAMVRRTIAEAQISAIACHGGVTATNERLSEYWCRAKRGI